ncbi:protein POF1B [Candoia aspera]|uniref:protein POF1B n=1 Tax=Candoia aspera TaxID=51853 RepID=UPI002FD82280
MFGVQQQVQPAPVPPPWGARPQYAAPSPPRSYCPAPPPPPPPPSRPWFEPGGPADPAPLPATLPRARQSRPAPLPLLGQACPEPFPPQDACNGGSVVYERVRTYSSPGGKRVPLLDPPSDCSPRTGSPFDAGPGYQHVIWSSDPPLQEVASPALKLSPYSQSSVRRIILENPEKEPLSPLLRGGSNVIYEKTIRKYELLKPEEEKQYQYALQQNQTDYCQVSQPVERVQVVPQCQTTGNACNSTPACANDVGRGSINKVIKCELVKSTQQMNDQLDCRYFGELLAELHRKSNDLHSCLLQHIEKLGGRRYKLEFLNETEDIESLIPKGLSESTKQQIRYLLEMRVTADKSMRLVLATFNGLREELLHLQDDLGKLEMDKMLLEKDLAFKETQVKEYEMLLASVRENNHQQQQALREYTLKCRSLEEQLLSFRHNDSEREFRLKDLEYSKQALEQEIQNLRLQTSTNPLGQTTTDELSSRYVEMINQLREDKDREIRCLRSQLSEFQKDFSRKQGSDADLQMKVQELILKLEEREACIKRQEEEVFRLRQENLTNQFTKTIITKKFRNQYPILGLLSDDYKVTSPVRESQTIVIEKTGERWKQELFPSN